MNTVVIGISSGIAAFKMLDVIALLRKKNIAVEVIETHHATKMLAPELLEKETEKKVSISLYPKDFNYEEVLKERVVDHIALADKADVFVIAPATANCIAKLAHGIADDFLTTTALAVTAPIIVCPSMNVNMWNNPAVQDNITMLKQRGFIIIEPEVGALACGYEGKGRLASPTTITNEIDTQLQRATSLAGKTVLITAGGTSEAIDSVRTITNKSTGKMGIALAEECYLRGATVILLKAHSSVLPQYQVNIHEFTSSKDLEKLLQTFANQADIILHAAAVSDFFPLEEKSKITSKKTHSILLKPQPKLLHQLRNLAPQSFIVGFKAEHEPSPSKLEALAKDKLEESGAHMIIANDISRTDRGFSANTNEVIVVSKKNPVVYLPLASKKSIAKGIVDAISKELAS